MKFFLKILAGFVVILVAGFFWILFWVGSPTGAKAASGWITAWVQRQVPETRVDVKRLQLVWPLGVTLTSVRWQTTDGESIVELPQVSLSLEASQWFRGSFQWSLQAQVDRLDLAQVDRVLVDEQWEAQGILSGLVTVSGIGVGMGDVSLRCEVQSPGGTLGSDMLTRLLSLMPTSDAKARLLSMIQQQTTFHFDVGRIEVRTQGDAYELLLLLDGDHLLDITVRIPKEGVTLWCQALFRK